MQYIHTLVVLRLWINTLTESDNIILGKRKTENAMPYIVDPTEARERNILHC